MTNNIVKSLESELSQVDTILEAIEHQDVPFEQLDFDDVRDYVQDSISEGVLSIDKTTVLTVLLGCGGPTRYFEIEFDSEGGAMSGKYVDKSFNGYVETDDKRTEIDLSSSEVDIIVERYGLDSYLKGGH